MLLTALKTLSYSETLEPESVIIPGNMGKVDEVVTKSVTNNIVYVDMSDIFHWYLSSTVSEQFSGKLTG